MKTQTAALNDLEKVLNKQAILKAAYESDKTKYRHIQKKITTWLLEQSEPVADIPDIVKQQEPFLAWKIGAKTDHDLLEAVKQIRDVLIPETEKQVEELVKELKEQKEELEKYALALLEQRGASNFSVTGIGRIEKRTDTKYNVADKVLLVADAEENGYVSELTITIRPNSKLMAQIVEEKGELPAGVSSFKEFKAVFVKA